MAELLRVGAVEDGWIVAVSPEADIC